MAWQTSTRVMEVRARNQFADVFVEMLDGWRRHLSGRNASLLAFFTFLSIFPLMLAAVTILGFVLEGNEELQQRIVDGAAAEIPVVGESLADDPQALTGNWWALIIGLGGALWSSTKAFVGLQGALDDTWEVPVDDRAGLPVQRGRAIIGLMIIGTAQLSSLAIASVVSAAGLSSISRILLMLATLIINILVIAAMFRFLTEASLTWRDVWPGAILAGIVFSILQRVGPEIVRSIAEGNAAYETFGVVIGLVTWLSFVAIATLMAAELNAAIVRRREGVPHPTMGADFDLPVRS